MVFPVVPPDMSTDTAAEYKANIDSSIRGLADVVTAFAPSENDPVSMSLLVNEGYMYNGVKLDTIEVTGIGAPSTGMRYDGFYLDINQETVVRVVGTESSGPGVLPTKPAFPEGKLPICFVLFTPGDTSIVNNMIEDVRPVFNGSLVYADSGWTFITDPEGIYRIAISGSFDKQIRLRLHATDGSSKIQVRNGSDATVAELTDQGNLLLAGTVTPSHTF